MDAWLLQELFQQLRSGAFDNPLATPATVLEQLATAAEALSEIETRAKECRIFEDLFNLQPSNYSDVEQVHTPGQTTLLDKNLLHQYEFVVATQTVHATFLCCMQTSNLSLAITWSCLLNV